MARFREKKEFAFKGDALKDVTEIDYKDAELLKKFMTDGGKVLPARFTGITAKQQRQIKRAIRRARVMGLLQ